MMRVFYWVLLGFFLGLIVGAQIARHDKAAKPRPFLAPAYMVEL